jgi:hypothetical protein
MPTGELVVYANPTRSEVLQLKKDSISSRDFYIRFIANAKDNIREVYVFDSNIAIHNDTLNLLGLSTRFSESPYLILGTGKVDSTGTINLFEVHFMQSEVLQLFSSPKKVIKFYDELFGYNWDWTDYYIRGLKGFLEKQKELFEKTKNAWYASKNNL